MQNEIKQCKHLPLTYYCNIPFPFPLISYDIHLRVKSSISITLEQIQSDKKNIV
jgi:hypothetical protein